MGDHRDAVVGGMAFAAVALAIVTLISTAVPSPYMDEVFHVPQAQSICAGDLITWDPKITTLPGTYVYGCAYGIARAVVAGVLRGRRAVADMDLFSLSVLRSANAAIGGATTAVIYLILRTLYPRVSKHTLGLKTVAVSLVPVHFFFHTMFYTDALSTFCVLATYCLTLRNRPIAAAFAGAFAVFTRQTNVVWVAFCGFAMLFQRAGVYAERGSAAPRTTVEEAAVLLVAAWNHRRDVFAPLVPYAAVGVAFVLFVVHNEGVVVGDREAHAAVFHPVQLLYFALYTGALLNWAACGPSALSSLWAAARESSPLARMRAALVLLWSAYAVHMYTLEHPYLLADNRHYPFYLWKNVMRRIPSARYVLVPVGLAAAARVWRLVGSSRRSRLWRAALLVCTAAVLVPAHLLEFRYFTVPFLLVTLHIYPHSKGQLYLDVALYTAVNVATLYIFIARPFTWVDGTTARFMW